MSDDEFVADSEPHGLRSRSGDEHAAGEQAEPVGAGAGRPDDHDDAVFDAEVVDNPDASAGESDRSLAERGSSDPLRDGISRQPGPGQYALFQASAGPLPEVDQLAAYGEVDPSFPERIMRMAEASTTDASRREDEALGAGIAERKRGQVSAIALAYIGIAAAIVFAVLGHYAFAGVLVSVPFVLLVRALVGDAGRKRGGSDSDGDERGDA